MRNLFLSLGFVALLFCLLTPGTSYADPVGHTYIAQTGTDGNSPCYNPKLPCANLVFTMSNTLPGGTLTCVGPTGLWTPSITKSIMIDCEGTNSTTNSFSVAIGATDTVTVRGLMIETAQGAAGGTRISFTGSVTLILEKLHLRNGPVGISFTPNGAGKLIVRDSIISSTGNGAQGGGIVVAPQPGGSAQVTLERVTVASNAFGIAFDGSNSTGGINATITDSVIASNTQDGIVATTTAGHAPIGVLVTNTKAVNNTRGVRAIGPNVTVRLDNSRVAGNGVGIGTLSGGHVLTLGNNVVRANGSDGAFSGALALQ
jgi:hypothetical protein